MDNKHNGSGAGGNGQDDKIVRFPTLAERDRIEREKRQKEEEWQKAYRAQKKREQKAAQTPFFNTGRIPPLTGGLVLAIVVVHVALNLVISAPLRFDLFTTFGFIPGRYTGAVAWDAGAWLAPLSYTFLHGGWLHLGFNTVMLLALGTAFERRYGLRKFGLYYIACALGGAALTLILNPSSAAPVIGASGAISGLFVAILFIFFEQGMVGSRMGKFARYGPWPVIVFWVGIFSLIGLISGGNIAWQAHLGGFLTGMALFKIIVRSRL